MLIVGSTLDGYAIQANDGRIGTVKTFLFDDRTWKIRWLVIDTGHWLPGRQVLLAPSAIGSPDHARRGLAVHLTMAQVEASPDIGQDQPVTLQMQSELHAYYGWDPYWGPDFYGTDIGGLGRTGGYDIPDRAAQTSLKSDMFQHGSGGATRICAAPLRFIATRSMQPTASSVISGMSWSTTSSGRSVT